MCISNRIRMSQLGYNPYLLNIIPLFNVADPSNSSTGTVASSTVNALETTIDVANHTLSIDTIQPFTSGKTIVINGDLEVTGEVQMDGDLTVSQDITCQTLYQLSDARRKKDIVALDGTGALELINKLQGVHYTLDGKPSIGFLAQEVEKVVPEAVSIIDGTYAIDYSKIIPLLVEALKEIAKKLPS
jgi:hypothetical protein